MTTDTSTFEPVTLYSNDFVMEQARQEALKDDEDRQPKLRNRIARAQRTKLILMAAVADKLGNSTIAAEALEAAGVPEGTNISDLYKVTQSRRPSVSKEAIELGLVDEATRAEVLAPKPKAEKPEAETADKSA